MKIFLFLFAFCLALVAETITNGDVKMYETSNPEELIIDSKEARWLNSAINQNMKFAY
ncbi:MAG: hypothetical protein ACTTJC_06345 [Campylobacter sp.]